MTLKGKITLGLCAMLLSGFGAYQLLRTNRGFSIGVVEKNYLPLEEFDGETANEDDPNKKEDETKEKDSKVSADSGENTDTTNKEGKNPNSENESKSTAETNSDKEQEKPNIEASPSIPEEPNQTNPTDTDKKASDEQDKAEAADKKPDVPINDNPKSTNDTKTVVEVGNGGNDVQGQSPKSTDTSTKETSSNTNDSKSDSEKEQKTDTKETSKNPTSEDTNTSDKDKSKSGDKKVKGQTYKEYITSQYKDGKILWVDGNTSNYTMKNIMLQRMFPQYRNDFLWSKDVMFKGSPELHFKGATKEKNGKKLFILKSHTDKEATALKNACIEALNQEKPEVEDSNTRHHMRGLRFWCTVPTIRDILKRYKFKIPETDEEWQKILDGEWVKNKDYKDKQSMFAPYKGEVLGGYPTSYDKYRIATLKTVCKLYLDRNFRRENFPADKEFLGGESWGVDPFQDAVLFCTVPKTAEEYIKEGMWGDIIDSIPKEWENDYCYIPGKDVDYYKKIKTTDVMEGKGFWCAVRMIYKKKENIIEHEHEM